MGAGATGPTRRHLHGLDGLRGVAALGVVTLHVWMYTGAHARHASPLVDAVVGELRVGVIAFFVLSAFLLSRPWLAAADGVGAAPRPAAFLVRRAARILPAYWFAVAGAFAILWRTGSARGADAGDLPLFAVLAQNHVERTRGQLVPPAWSLSVEMCFYVVLPLLGVALAWLCRRHGRVPAATAMAVGMAVGGLGWIALAQAVGWPRTVTTSLPTYLPVFACGILAAGVRPPRAPVARRALILVGAALVAANGLWHARGTGTLGHVVLDLPAAAGFALVVVGLVAGPPGLLELRPVRWLGTVSYGLYLWHLPILYALREEGVLPRGALVAMVAVLVPSLVMAALSWYGLERPVLRAGRRSRRRLAAEPAPA